MNDQKTADSAPVERWVDRVRYMNAAYECLLDTDGSILGPLPDRFRVADLPKTPEETAAIDEAIGALNEFRRILCGLPPVIFPQSRVHILSKEEFRSKISPARFQGKVEFGHVYLWRGWPPPVFLALLTHELVHAVSYLWLDLNEAGTIVGGQKLPRILQRRQGLILIDPSFNTLLPHFHGLNEGATETAAIIIRHMVASRTKLLDAASQATLSKFICSPPLVHFTERLAMLAAGAASDTIGVYRKLYVDCFTGTDEFLKALEPKLPGATEVLRATGARPDELAVAADKFGWADDAARIRQYGIASDEADQE
jgi:hypothetical protein